MRWVELLEFLCRNERPIADDAVPSRCCSGAAWAVRPLSVAHAVTCVYQIVHASTHGRPDTICTDEDIRLYLCTIRETQHEVGDGAVFVAGFRVTKELLPVVGGVAVGHIVDEDLDEVRAVHGGSPVYGIA